MLVTITATYRDPAALFNAVDELVNRGIPRDMIFGREDIGQVKVRIPYTVEPEVNHVLLGHRPTSYAGSSGRTVGSFWK